MSWKDRLQPEITLTSPDGDIYGAFWKGDPRNFEKKLGIFEYPKQSGAVIQDLDPRADRYNLTFFFEGSDHDIVARRFYNSCKQRGEWEVLHPTLGSLDLYLVKVQHDIQPVDSANVTQFTTEWIAPSSKIFSVSITQREAVATEKNNLLKERAADQFADQSNTTESGPLTQFRSSIENGAVVIKQALAPLTQTVAEVNAAVESVNRGITSAVAETELNVVSLASQIQTLVTLPATVPQSIGVRLDYYRGLLDTIISGTPEKPTAKNKNVLVYNELVLTSVLSSVAEVLIDNTVDTREEVVEFIESINQMFFDATAALDAGQELYIDSIIDRQYFSLSSTFNTAVLLLSDINTLLLRRLFDLAAAKRFTLGRHRAPVEIAITEGVDLDLFIQSNKLSNTDILLLPAGREVVVYL